MAPDSSRTIILGSLPAFVEERTVRMAAPLRESLPPRIDDAWTAAPRAAAARRKEPPKDRGARPRRTMLIPIMMSLTALLLGVGTGYVVRERSAVAAPRPRAPHEVVGVSVGMDTKVRAKSEAPKPDPAPAVDAPAQKPAPVAHRPAAPRPPASPRPAAKPAANEFGDLETSFRVMP